MTHSSRQDWRYQHPDLRRQSCHPAKPAASRHGGDKGMLIAFEGQEGAGKSSLLDAVRRELERQRVPVVAVSEFSGSPYGVRLLKALDHDRFLRPVGDEATSLTRALDIVADLYYLDRQVIAPALADGAVVLKDRHADTVLTTQAAALTANQSVRSESRALTWLSVVLSELRHRPALTVYVDAPLQVRLERIRSRTRHRAVTERPAASQDDLAVFAERDRLMRQLIDDDPCRFLVVDNGSRPLQESARAVVSQIFGHCQSKS